MRRGRGLGGASLQTAAVLCGPIGRGWGACPVVGGVSMQTAACFAVRLAEAVGACPGVGGVSMRPQPPPSVAVALFSLPRPTCPLGPVWPHQAAGESEGALQRAHAGLHGAHVLTCEVGALPQRLLVCGLQGQASSSGKRSAQGHAEGVGPLLREAGSFSVRFSPCRHQVAGGAGGGRGATKTQRSGEGAHQKQ